MSWGRLGSHGKIEVVIDGDQVLTVADLSVEVGGAGYSGVEVPQRNPPVPRGGLGSAGGLERG